MKVVSFNVNGLRARFHQLAAVVEHHQPDIIGLQETKVDDGQFPLAELAPLGYHVQFYGQKSHYGVALLTRAAPLAVQKGFPNDPPDAQRRLIAIDLPSPWGVLRVINGYFPQGESRDHPVKFPAKQRFYQAVLRYLQQHCDPRQPVILMGDMNVSLTAADIGVSASRQQRWLENGVCSFLPEEQAWLGELLDWGLTDVWRCRHPHVDDQFSWFDYRTRGFCDNRGLRLDFLLASAPLAQHCQQAGIDYAIRAMDKPSDHAPVWAEFVPPGEPCPDDDG